MVDHKRMDALTELIERSGAKLIAVGDGKQLPVDRTRAACSTASPPHAPTAELGEVRRTSDPEERKAWAALRAGEPERAMAHYQCPRPAVLHRHPRPGRRGRRATLGRADRDTRHPRGRADRRRLERRDRPAQRPRPAPPRRTRRTRPARDPAAAPALRAARRRPDRVHRAAPHAGAATGRERRPRRSHPRPRRTA